MLGDDWLRHGPQVKKLNATWTNQVLIIEWSGRNRACSSGSILTRMVKIEVPSWRIEADSGTVKRISVSKEREKADSNGRLDRGKLARFAG